LGNPGYFKNITIQHDSINLGNYGICVIGAVVGGNGAGVNILSNALHATGTSAIGDYGIYLQGMDSSIIGNNKIGNFTGTNVINDRGIWIGSGSKNISVFGNTIYNLTAPANCGAYGIQIASGIANNGINVFNNMISNVSGGGNNNNNATNRLSNPAGILLTGSQSGTQILFNSIHLFGGTMNNNNAVSAAGSTQADATALTVDYNVATTVASSTGVKLPTATAGRRIIIVNKGANTLSIYPATGGTIDALSANAAIQVAANGSIELMASSVTQWYSISRVAIYDSAGALLN
jgi:hypothetical protein